MLCILVASLLMATQTYIATSLDDHGYHGVLNDHFQSLNPRSGSRFLANVVKGDKCDLVTNNVCPGIPAKGNSQLLYCCKNHCRNILSDRNNCGVCGNKCGFGQLCCNGKCTAVAYDVSNCGECGNVCKAGVRCEYGSCGYA
ncbi:protein GRIM REAPER-like [Dioscorea cayenensis subsp. rotundata]|uniref:Protein GRIM REAPER-like n=1 Tax=Dioscorea cayennensis subsp. rotundata TaxID=55577 RepID=A0AB40CRW4_DIOCR|nr:protein GRIM REAPER-like [Dioscorea cayenensis subsp. rotundata]